MAHLQVECTSHHQALDKYKFAQKYTLWIRFSIDKKQFLYIKTIYSLTNFNCSDYFNVQIIEILEEKL